MYIEQSQSNSINTGGQIKRTVSSKVILSHYKIKTQIITKNINIITGSIEVLLRM